MNTTKLEEAAELYCQQVEQACCKTLTPKLRGMLRDAYKAGAIDVRTATSLLVNERLANLEAIRKPGAS